MISRLQTMRYSIRCAAALLLLCNGSTAGAVDLYPEPPSAPYVEPPPWQEKAAALPAWPADADLLAFPVDVPGSSLSYRVDARSLSVGADGVVRYSVVIASASDTRNVLFEGIRCATREYRTYAYGEAGKHFRPAQDDHWQRVGSHGWERYRAVLQRYYLCDEHLSPYSIHEILRRLNHPQSVQSE